MNCLGIYFLFIRYIMTTRKALIIQKYTALEAELKLYIKDEIFPSLDSIDVADLVYIITMLFLGIDTPDAYDLKITELIQTNKISMTDDVYSKISPLIIEFIVWLKSL